ncbi:MAG TPA: RHS repeat-associated core domain-containing protein [Acidimicrobiales bacterium]|nr:RHS repeat-associated core domain-containing protein [Acidimicrobiales bacterium]
MSVTNAHLSGAVSPPTSTFTYWPDGLLASSTSPLGGAHATVSYFYDARGNRTERSSWTQATSTAAPHLVVDTWVYDLAGRVVRDRPAGDPIGTTVAYNDVHGRPEVITKPSGNLTVQAWWNSGAPRATLDVRLATGSTPGQNVWRCDWHDTAANTTHTLQRIDAGWDACDAGTPIAQTWTPTGELASVRFPDNVNTPAGVDETFAYTWDLNGLARTTTFADGVVHTTSHDRLGRIAQTRTNSPTDTPIAAYTYDANANVTSETVSGGQTTRAWTYPTNGATHPTSYTQTSPGANRTTTLAWNPTGDLATETTAGATRAYSYDPARQLLARTDTAGPDHTYTYGPRGLRHTESIDGWARSYTYNDWAQPVTVNYGLFQVDNTYTPDGQLQAATSAVLGQSTYTYDPRGYTQTTTVDLNPGIGDDLTDTRSYNPWGQISRSQRSVNNTPSADTTYLPNPPRPATQPLLTRTSPTTQARAHHGIGLVGHQHNTNPPTNLAFDHQHSVIANTAAPNLPTTYDPYGTPTPTRPTQLGYRTETHYGPLLHLRNRDYTPDTGHFTTPHPLDGQPATTTETNPYHYTNNNPTNHTDPHGLSPTDSTLHPFRPSIEWRGPPMSTQSAVGESLSSTSGRSDQRPLLIWNDVIDVALKEAGCTDVDLKELPRLMEGLMRGALPPPCGFARQMRYKPTKLTGTKAAAVLMVSTRANSGCSGGPLAELALEHAYDAFHDSCRSHDYGYDVIRLEARRSEGPLSPGFRVSLHAARTRADEVMNEFMASVCANTGLVGWKFDKFRCHRARMIIYITLKVWTSIEEIPS